MLRGGDFDRASHWWGSNGHTPLTRTAEQWLTLHRETSAEMHRSIWQQMLDAVRRHAALCASVLAHSRAVIAQAVVGLESSCAPA